MIDFKLLVAHSYLENLQVIINNSLGFSHLSQFGRNKNMRPPCSARGKCFPKRQGTWAIPFSRNRFTVLTLIKVFRNCSKISIAIFSAENYGKTFLTVKQHFPEGNFSEKIIFRRRWILCCFFLDFNRKFHWFTRTAS